MSLPRRFLAWALARAGLRLSRVRETVVLPRPRPGPARTAAVGIDWNPAEVDRILERVLPGGIEGVAAIDGYRPDNPFFGLVDAAVAFALVREQRPSRIVEVGSGHSTRVLRVALEASGSRGTLVAIDPEPRIEVAAWVDEHLPRRVEETDPAFFAELPSDAVLFVDSSHRCGTGSDVNFLFLEALPRLSPGVLVHVHDVYLPEDYPPSWNLDRGFLYSEQYLLQALLAFSRGFEVVWPGRWVLRERRAALAAVFPAGADLERHCSFWLRRRERRELEPAR